MRLEVTIKQAERKIYFIASCVASSLAAIITALKTSAVVFQGSYKAKKLNNKAETKGKCLIEKETVYSCDEYHRLIIDHQP
jgi:phosphoribosyl-AMP cyclohydrolase